MRSYWANRENRMDDSHFQKCLRSWRSQLPSPLPCMDAERYHVQGFGEPTSWCMCAKKNPTSMTLLVDKSEKGRYIGHSFAHHHKASLPPPSSLTSLTTSHHSASHFPPAPVRWFYIVGGVTGLPDKAVDLHTLGASSMASTLTTSVQPQSLEYNLPCLLDATIWLNSQAEFTDTPPPSCSLLPSDHWDPRKFPSVRWVLGDQSGLSSNYEYCEVSEAKTKLTFYPYYKWMKSFERKSGRK